MLRLLNNAALRYNVCRVKRNAYSMVHQVGSLIHGWKVIEVFSEPYVIILVGENPPVWSHRYKPSTFANWEQILQHIQSRRFKCV